MLPHTATEMLPAIGTLAHLRTDGLCVTVRVLDVKRSYGAVRLLVTPVDGIGEVWVDVSRLRSVHDTRAIKVR